MHLCQMDEQNRTTSNGRMKSRGCVKIDVTLKTLILALKDSAAAFIALLMYNNFIAKWNAEF